MSDRDPAVVGVVDLRAYRDKHVARVAEMQARIDELEADKSRLEEQRDGLRVALDKATSERRGARVAAAVRALRNAPWFEIAMATIILSIVVGAGLLIGRAITPRTEPFVASDGKPAFLVYCTADRPEACLLELGKTCPHGWDEIERQGVRAIRCKVPK